MFVFQFPPSSPISLTGCRFLLGSSWMKTRRSLRGSGVIYSGERCFFWYTLGPGPAGWWKTRVKLVGVYSLKIHHWELWSDVGHKSSWISFLASLLRKFFQDLLEQSLWPGARSADQQYLRGWHCQPPGTSVAFLLTWIRQCRKQEPSSSKICRSNSLHQVIQKMKACNTHEANFVLCPCYNYI